MNTYVKQVYNFVLGRRAPVNELKAYIAAHGILEEIEWDIDDGLELMHDEHFRYKSMDYLFNTFLQPDYFKRN